MQSNFRPLDLVALQDLTPRWTRYMDDIIILSRKRWHLRGAMKTLNSVFVRLKLAQAPDKTFTGYIEKGFDFPGYRSGRKRSSLAAKTIENALDRLHRLYEQQKTAPDKGAAVLGAYPMRWRRWTTAGLIGIDTSLLSRFALPPQTQNQETQRDQRQCSG